MRLERAPLSNGLRWWVPCRKAAGLLRGLNPLACGNVPQAPNISAGQSQVGSDLHFMGSWGGGVVAGAKTSKTGAQRREPEGVCVAGPPMSPLRILSVHWPPKGRRRPVVQGAPGPLLLSKSETVTQRDTNTPQLAPAPQRARDHPPRQPGNHEAPRTTHITLYTQTTTRQLLKLRDIPPACCLRPLKRRGHQLAVPAPWPGEVQGPELKAVQQRGPGVRHPQPKRWHGVEGLLRRVKSERLTLRLPSGL